MDQAMIGASCGISSAATHTGLTRGSSVLRYRKRLPRFTETRHTPGPI